MAMMVKNLIKEKRGMISAIAAVVILYIVLECFGITCPIKFITEYPVQVVVCREHG